VTPTLPARHSDGPIIWFDRGSWSCRPGS